PNQVVSVSGGSSWSVPAFESGPAEVAKEKLPILIYRDKTEHAAQVIPFDGAIPYSGPASQGDFVVPVSASPYGYGFVVKAEFDPKRTSSQLVSVPLRTSAGAVLGALEISNGPSYGADVINSVSRAWLLASAFAVVIAALAGWFMSQRVTRPVLALENATRQMEQGDLSVRVHLKDERQQEFLSLANSFNGMAEQVEQTVSTLRAFIADAAHELHTPLTALQTNLELADEALAPGARTAENASARTLYLSRAQEQSQRLEALVTSLLDLSRIESTQLHHNFAPLDLNQLVSEVSEQFASRAEQTNRLFTLNMPAETLMVNGNEMQVKQVLANLLENALKFTPEDRSITLTLRRLNGDAILTVMDTGIGILPEDLPHMFERFHRGRNASEYAGNGLGLAIVKAIVESYSGRVDAQSKGVGDGSTFSVRLPAHS
ncbi:MAG: HAMP domain-containing histidine kinase, partial [Chloroflexota bacterium]|nr:HAMP domain-containing histidine kinase [Chloroflexota bacterium]